MRDYGYGINCIPFCQLIENANKLLDECRNDIMMLTTPKIK